MTTKLIRTEAMRDTTGTPYMWVRTYATSSPHIEYSLLYAPDSDTPCQVVLYVGRQDFEAVATPDVLDAIERIDEMNAADFLQTFFIGK